MVLLSHPTGNANAREAARALNEVGLLSELWTSVYWRREHPLNLLLPGTVIRELNRRAFPHVDRNQVRCNPWRETGRLLANRLGFSTLTRHEVGRFSVDAVYRSLDRRVAARLHRESDVFAVYAYEDGALESFRAARNLGIRTVYELPIGYWRFGRELLKEEAALQPEWAFTLPGNSDSKEKLERKDEELALADHIVVPSEFVRRTLSRGAPLQARMSVVPYGAPSLGSAISKAFAPAGKLRVIFVGMLSQRKGISYLLRAVEQMASKVELTLIGRRVGQCSVLDSALQAHRWIPSLTHSEVLQEIERHDVLVLPSLLEGSALVVLEAMSRGVPVITTPHGGAPDFLSDGEDGFIVPIRDSEAIAEKLEILLGDRAWLATMSEAATRKAAQHSWQHYRERLASTVKETLKYPAHLDISRTPQFEACNS